MAEESTSLPEIWEYGVPTAQEHLNQIDRLPQYNRAFTGDYPGAYYPPRPPSDPSYPGAEPNSQAFLDVQRTMLSLQADAEATIHGQRAKAFYKRVTKKMRMQIRREIAEEMRRDNRYVLMQQKETIVRGVVKLVREKVEREVRLERLDRDEVGWRMRIRREIEEEVRGEMEGEWDGRVRREVETVREECRREYEERLEEYKRECESRSYGKDGEPY